MTDYTTISLADARRDYLQHTTPMMPVGGMISWGVYAILLATMPNALPWWAALVVGAVPVPLAILFDKVRGTMAAWTGGNDNPIAALFFRSIMLVTFIVPIAMITFTLTENLDLLILTMAILSGSVWVAHGWATDDPAGFTHFVVRGVACYAAYFLVPEAMRGAAIAGIVSVTYVYAVVAMKKPDRVTKA